LYAADAFGSLVRWDLDDRGKPVNKQTLLADPKQSRQYIDLEWDPAASADKLILWVSYAERLAPKDDRHFFTGTIARLQLADSGPGTFKIDEQVIVTGLAHGREKQGGFDTLPHQPNGLVFKDGKLYQSVGSTSSSGGPANWGLAEQVLSACIIEIDATQIRKPLDVHPQTGYPSAPAAPLRIFATGVRNALELVAHTNGRLYSATNINDRAGRGDGVPDDPDIDGDQNELITQTTPNHESLYLIERGRHYGHPNPARGQHVLAGGNPTAGVDPFEITDYPVGTKPEAGFAAELMYPLWQHGGTSPNGMIEYLPSFPHPLRNSLVCCFYSAGDIAVMPLGADGMPTLVAKLRGPNGKLRLGSPLDITMDPASGILYVADFGLQSKFGADGSMAMLRPAYKAAAADQRPPP
jgi:glucose/arabinose dehydrogenase